MEDVSLSKHELFPNSRFTGLPSPLPGTQSVKELVGAGHCWLQHVSNLLEKK